MPGYLLCDDLIFTSRVLGTARDLGLEWKSARSPEQLTSLMATQAPECLVLDLHTPGLSIGDFVSHLPEPRPYVVAFGSHVDTTRLKGARDAGCDLVLARSRFVEELPKSLKTWFAARSTLQ